MRTETYEKWLSEKLKTQKDMAGFLSGSFRLFYLEQN